jgi:hypothetical protein
MMSWKVLRPGGTVVLPGVNPHNSGLKSQLLHSGNLIALPDFRRERIPARAFRGHAVLVTITAPSQFLGHGAPTERAVGRAWWWVGVATASEVVRGESERTHREPRWTRSGRPPIALAVADLEP